MFIGSITGEQIEVPTLRWKFEGGEESEICDENPWAVSTEEDLCKVLNAMGWEGGNAVEQFMIECGMQDARVEELLDQWNWTMGSATGFQDKDGNEIYRQELYQMGYAPKDWTPLTAPETDEDELWDALENEMIDPERR